MRYASTLSATDTLIAVVTYGLAHPIWVQLGVFASVFLYLTRQRTLLVGVELGYGWSRLRWLVAGAVASEVIPTQAIWVTLGLILLILYVRH